MDFTQITLEKKELIEKIRSSENHILMSHSFDTLFLWKETLKLLIYTEEDFFVVKTFLDGDNEYFFPCGNKDKVYSFISQNINSKGFTLKYLREEDKAFLEENFAGKFEIEYDESSCEYIFDKNEHLELKGKKYAKIRYSKNHLVANNSLSTKVINKETISDAKRILSRWKKNHHSTDEEVVEDDLIVAHNVFDYFEQMNFVGTLVYIDDKPLAMVVGSKITADTFAVQIAKMRVPIDGLLFYALHSCFAILPEEIRYVNGDDDMGIEGIRIHKKKMKPCRMNEVWRAKLL